MACCIIFNIYMSLNLKYFASNFFFLQNRVPYIGKTKENIYFLISSRLQKRKVKSFYVKDCIEKCFGRCCD